MTTLEFRTEKSYLRIWDALNDTSVHFASYAYKAITLFNDKDAEMVKEACDDAGIKYKEI